MKPSTPAGCAPMCKEGNEQVQSTRSGFWLRLWSILFLSAGLTQHAKATEAWYEVRKIGGEFTVYSYGESPYNHGAPFLNLEQRRAFSGGAVAFSQSYSVKDGSNASDGIHIGGDHNAQSCEACHYRDGRGISHSKLFANTGFAAKPRPSGTKPVPFRIPWPSGTTPKLLGVEWQVKQKLKLTGPETVELVAPVSIVNGKRRAVDLRNAPAVYGLGLLEAIPADEIRKLSNEQPYKKSGVRGIIGNACSTTDESVSCKRVGRFGWKATIDNLDTQTRSALFGELGIASPDNSSNDEENRQYEVSVKAIAGYMRALAVPARRIDGDDRSIQGASLFESVGCLMCHKASWRTGASAEVDQIVRDQHIYPFTDLLLHDMGEGLADSNKDKLSSFWKTPALWGIGMQKTVAANAGYLHDGRARNFLEAILWHGGEASASVEKFRALSKKQRDSLIAFLDSL